jgi:hypothetical protein
MGGTHSSLNIDNTLMNKVIVDVINKNQSSSSQSGSSIQTLIIENAKFDCDLSVTQSGSIQVKTLQNITSDTSSSLITSIMDTLQSQNKDKFDETTGWGAIPENKSIIDNVKNSITTDLKTQLTTENLNKIVQNINSIQNLSVSNIVVDPCGYELLPKVSDAVGTAITKSCTPKPPCTIDQNLSVSLFAQQVTETVMSVISNNKSASDLLEKFDKDTTVTSTGIFQDIFNGISSIFGKFTWIVIVLILAIPIIIIALAYFASSDGGKKLINTGGNVAKARMMIP